MNNFEKTDEIGDCLLSDYCKDNNLLSQMSASDQGDHIDYIEE
jgi:hypothetical protein